MSTALLHPPGEREERKTKKEWKLSDGGRAALVVTVVEAVIMAIKYVQVHVYTLYMYLKRKLP